MNRYESSLDFVQTNAEKYKKVSTIRVDITCERRDDGSAVLRSTIPLEPYPFRLTERFAFHAARTPDKIFIGSRAASGQWIELSYGDAYARVRRLAQALLNRHLSPARPLVILSENSIEHALMALAAMHVGIPHASIAPAYSLKSEDYNKLHYVFEVLEPGLVFVQDSGRYEKALRAVAQGVEVAAVSKAGEFATATAYAELEQTDPTAAVDKAYGTIGPDTIAKFLFTSGSTGQPKGVINTHGNISANWQQITQTFPFLRDEGLEFLDWLPWNHTFGGNHNLGLAIYNGGSFYIDDGSPTPEGILATVNNLRERNPTVYFNVPKGFEELLPHFKKDKALCRRFFSSLKMLFYAGAGMPQHVWDAWEQLSMETTGEKILIGTGLGCTESSPSALFSSEQGGYAGLLGVPVPGLELKLVPMQGKLEARYRGRNIFPGYWKQPALSEKVFDDEGFYCTGDALKFADPDDANKGMIFDGRFAEDFKLSTGTWVRVGILRAQIIAAGKGLIREVVITGHDRDFVGAIIFPGLQAGSEQAQPGPPAGLKPGSDLPSINKRIGELLLGLADRATGTSSLVRRALLADFELSIDKGEITDKGTINQRMVIRNHQDLVERLYAEKGDPGIIEIPLNLSKQRL